MASRPGLSASGRVRPSRGGAAYARVEWLDKDILDAGFHPIGIGHTHRQSRVGAFTLGGVKDVVTGAFGRLGVGAVTVTNVDGELLVDCAAARVSASGTRGGLRVGTGSAAVLAVAFTLLALAALL